MEESLRETVKAVLIIADKDDDAAASLDVVIGTLKGSDKVPVPSGERVVAKGKGDFPSIVILMVPMTGDGNIETISLKAAIEKWTSMATPLDNYIDSSPAKKWGLSKQSKARITALLAATCEPRPDATFCAHWQVKKEEFHIPVTSTIFSEIVDFLKGFAALLDGKP